MNDKKLISILKTAYAVRPSDRERAFLRRYGKRSFTMRQALLMEAGYMCPKSVACALALFAALFLLMRCEPADGRSLQLLASALPLSVLCPLTMLGRSERCAMSELEAACRFSLRFLRMARLLLTSLLAVLFLLLGFLLLRTGGALWRSTAVFALATPYLAAIYGCLVVTRKRPGNESLYGCFAVVLTAGFVPYLAPAFAKLLPMLAEAAPVLTAVALMGLIAGEYGKYIKESEDVVWNLC